MSVGEELGENLDVGRGRDNGALAEPLGDLGDDEETDGKEELGGNGEKAGLEYGEAELLEGVG
jgi:hypothetical protein